MAKRERFGEPLATVAITIKASQLEWIRSRPELNLSAFVRNALDGAMKNGH
jgi:hypothetical protein